MAFAHTLSFQLYTSRSAQSVDEQLKLLAELGYTNVEPYDVFYDDVDGFRASLDTYGLKSESGHFSLSLLESEPEKAVSIAKALGMSLIVSPWLDPEDRPTNKDGWKALGARLEKLSTAFAAHGLKFAWHNHDFEFTALTDRSFPIEHLMDGTTFGLELDVAWVIRGGQDPLTWMERYADRLVAFHVKDMAPAGENLEQDGWTDVGSGVIDWAALWAAAKATPARYGVLEHDEPADWRTFAATSADFVKRNLSA
jgi:sugar phosphate isomerase/epimerase